MDKRRSFAPWPAAPGNAATIVLLCTRPRRPGGAGPETLPQLKGGSGERSIDAVTITWHANDQASAANGMRVYASDDNGVTWYETDLKNDVNVATIGSGAPQQVPVLAAGQEWRETLILSHLKDFAIEYTAGATGPTAGTGWRGTIAVDFGAIVVSR